ncbi:ABC transporter ATP-binding protein [Streptomyces sp. NPDC048564]|uniref:ABC transporter ATP-binding protein n=1 Tax=Streptomyces sp. NPDC048564 TaxID=3155760 RepID=UPI00341F9EF7
MNRIASRPSDRSGGVVELIGLHKAFGHRTVVDGIDLHIPSGQFFSLLGPSGCGKTTTLRMIAGFEDPTGGTILIDQQDMVGIPAHRRPTNTVFQSYALFPHLTVEENVAYGLRWHGRGPDGATGRVSGTERKRRVREALDLVELAPYAARRIHQLSGGQQQRVALARALVLRPSVLLLDEPLGALDARLRKNLREELLSLHRAVGTTFVFVTHDQEEALEMSDRIAVMDQGKVVQCGPPREVYETPQTEFVADFLGVANLLDGQLLERGSGSPGPSKVRIGDFTVPAACAADTAPGPVRVVVRPERIRLEPQGKDGIPPNTLPCVVDRLVYVGATTQVMARLPHGPALRVLVVNDSDRDLLSPGTPALVSCAPEAIRVLAKD